MMCEYMSALTAIWVPERDARLRELWDAGVSANGIAEQLGISKGSALGRAHRLGLPTRGSPIAGRGGEGRREYERKLTEFGARLQELHARHLTDRQIAEEMGVKYERVRRRRAALGLPPHHLAQPQKARASRKPPAAPQPKRWHPPFRSAPEGKVHKPAKLERPSVEVDMRALPTPQQCLYPIALRVVRGRERARRIVSSAAPAHRAPGARFHNHNIGVDHA